MADATTQDQIVAAIRRIVRAVDLHSRRLVENFGLTGPQLAVLAAIARLGPVSLKAVAREAHLSQATMTGILYRLEARGLISRTRSEADRRSFLVQVTPEGSRALSAAPSLLQDRFRHELERLEQWEQTQMLATLQRIAAMMDAEDLDSSPHLTSESGLGMATDPDQPLL